MSDRVGPLTSVLLFTTEARFPAMRAFYLDKLGLEASADRGMRTAFDWKSGDLRVRLILSLHDALTEAPASDPYRMILNFQVDDCQATAARMEAAGVEFSQPATQLSWGGWVATFEDPDGNIVQLLQPAAE